MGVMMSEHEWPARRACAGDCNQGRRTCTTPDACRLPEVDSMRHYWLTKKRVIWVALALAAIGVLWAVAP